MRDQWDNNNKLWQNRLRAISRQINERSEGVQYTFFEAMQTIMDYMEETFEKVMIPPTPGELIITFSVEKIRPFPSL